MEKPYYLALEESETPKIEIKNGIIYVVAGSQDGIHGATKPTALKHYFVPTLKKVRITILRLIKISIQFYIYLMVNSKLMNIL